MENTIHFILQGKGGIGKSFVSALLAQYVKSKAGSLKAFDTDQVNTTFAYYKALDVEAINLMDDNEIDPKGFDIMIEKLITEDGPFVVDNGANTFSPLLSYMVESDIFSLLRDSGKKVYVHTIVGGGDAMADTANGFNSIARGIGADTPLVLWLNEHFGAMTTVDGKDFTNTNVFKNHQDRLHGIVTLVARNPKTTGKDINTMNAKRLTFDEVKESKEFMIAEKQRLHIVGKEVFAQLDQIEF